MPEPLAVLRNSVRIGTLRTDGGRMAFDYTTDVTEPISVAMPTSTPTHGVKVADPWFHGLLPDNDNVLQRWAALAGVNPRSPFALLGAYGADVAGALQICPPDQIPDVTGRSAIPQELPTAAIAAILRDENADDSHWPAQRWSLAGAQGKFTAIRTASGWAAPTGGAASTHIIKPGIPRFEHQALNEHLCMTAAKNLGHATAATEFTVFDGEPAIVITRYDRFTGPDGNTIRVHQEDMCQALSVAPSKKYSADGGPGAADIARLLNRVAGERDVLRFASAVVLQALIGAPDGHARNYSLLLHADTVRLAPLYDIASTLPYHPNARSGLARTAMSIGGRSRFGEIGDRHIARFADSIGIDPDALVSAARRDAAALPDALADAARATHHPAAAKVADQIIAGVQAVTTHTLLTTPSSSTADAPAAPKSSADVHVQAHVRGGHPIGDYNRRNPHN